MDFNDEDFLQLSGLQHFKFCRRQWALIHIENQWAENYRTTDGAILHENAHDGAFTESRGNFLITRDICPYQGQCRAPQGARGLK